MTRFRLIHGNGYDTTKALEMLSEGAKKGDVIGVAYVVFFRNRTYIPGYTGIAKTEPELALGALAMLEDGLKDQIRNKF